MRLKLNNFLSFFILLLINIFLCCFYKPDPSPSELLWPIDRPQRITGTFCEPRGTRFHVGLDISCAGRTGFKIYAADDGYVSTVMYQKWGIGYAVFITHPGGRRTFYGHMDRFAARILKDPNVVAHSEDILNRKDFRVDYSNKIIKVKKGTIVGYSGESGLGKPHFHFEIRDPHDINLNPLRYGIKIIDTTAPVLMKIFFVPMDGYSHVNFSPTDVSMGLIKKDRNKYEVKNKEPLEFAGKIGIKIKAFDKAGYRRKVAVYKLALFLDNRMVYSCSFDRLQRDRRHHMGLYYDYCNTNNSNYTHYLYSRIDGKGIINTEKWNKTVKIKVIAYDANLNKSTFSGVAKVLEPLEEAYYKKDYNLIPGKKIKLRSSDKKVEFSFTKRSAFYREEVSVTAHPPLSIPFKNLKARSNMYTLGPSDLCLDEKATLTFKYDGDDYKKVGVYILKPWKKSFYFIGNNYNEREKVFLVTLSSAGAVFLLRDDIPPKLRIRKVNKVKPGHQFKIYVSDIGTGIDLNTVDCKVDGKNVHWDLDPDYGYIEILRHNKIWRPGEHRISCQVRDRAGNKSRRLKATYSI